MSSLLLAVPQGWVLGIALVALLTWAVLLSAHTALEEIGRSDVAALQRRDKRGAEAVAGLFTRREEDAAALALLRVLTQTLMGLCITLSLTGWLARWWQVLVAAFVLMGVLLALGVFPRALAKRRPGDVLHALRRVVPVTSMLARPGTRVLAALRPNEQEDEDSTEDVVDDLRDMVDRVSSSEKVDEEERTLLQSVVELSSTMVREVMVPRPDMITLDAETRLGKALTLFMRSGFSRLPVIGESVDDVRGILYLKDALRRINLRPDGEQEPVGAIAREPVYVPETVRVDDLLRQMQAEAFHIAMVADEYGGIAGLVTLEDLLEELVGEMVDEHDRAEPEAESLDDGVVRVPARYHLDDLGELFGIDIADDDVDSAGGLLAKALGKMPIPGDHITTAGLDMTAERSAGRRRQIATILVRRAAVGKAEEDDE